MHNIAQFDFLCRLLRKFVGINEEDGLGCPHQSSRSSRLLYLPKLTIMICALFVWMILRMATNFGFYLVITVRNAEVTFHTLQNTPIITARISLKLPVTACFNCLLIVSQVYTAKIAPYRTHSIAPTSQLPLCS